MLETWKILVVFSFVFNLPVDGEPPVKGNRKDDSFYNNFNRNNLEAWEAPLEYQNTFSYYWSGFDEECRPIWIGEMGLWDVRKFVLQGTESRKTLDKYIHQAIHRILQSLSFNNSDCETKPTEIISILDVDNFQYAQVASTQTVHYMLDMLKVHIDVMLKHVHNVYFVNTNFMANGFLLIARPILGEFMERVEVYGTRKSTWLPKLLKKLPWDQLPAKYGGTKNFQPLKIYG